MQLMQVVKETQVESEPWTKPGEQVIRYHLTMEITWKLQGNDWILIYQICVASGSLQLSSYVQHFFCLSYNWKLQIPWHKEKISSGSEPSVLRLGICGHPGIPAIPNPEINGHVGILASTCTVAPFNFHSVISCAKSAHPSPPEPPVSPSPSNLLACCANKNMHQRATNLVQTYQNIHNKWHPCFLLQAQVQFISSKSKLCIWLSMHILMVGTRSRLVDLEVHPICPSKCPHQITQTVFSLASWESSFTYNFQQLLFNSHDKAMRKGQEKWRRENKKGYVGHLPWVPMFWLSKMSQPPQPAIHCLEKNGVKFQMPFNQGKLCTKDFRATKIPRAASQSESCTCCSSCAIGACSMLLNCYAPGSARHKQPRKAKDCFLATPKIR